MGSSRNLNYTGDFGILIGRVTNRVLYRTTPSVGLHSRAWTGLKKLAGYESHGFRGAWGLFERGALAAALERVSADVKGSMVVILAVAHLKWPFVMWWVASRSLRGAALNGLDIVQLRNKLICWGCRTRAIKWKIGSAYSLQPEKTMEVRGRNLVTGLPESIEISSIEMREALAGSVQVIVDTIRDALDEIPPEIVADLMDIGICLAGGGGLLQGC